MLMRPQTPCPGPQRHTAASVLASRRCAVLLPPVPRLRTLLLLRWGPAYSGARRWPAPLYPVPVLGEGNRQLKRCGQGPRAAQACRTPRPLLVTDKHSTPHPAQHATHACARIVHSPTRQHCWWYCMHTTTVPVSVAHTHTHFRLPPLPPVRARTDRPCLSSTFRARRFEAVFAGSAGLIQVSSRLAKPPAEAAGMLATAAGFPSLAANTTASTSRPSQMVIVGATSTCAWQSEVVGGRWVRRLAAACSVYVRQQRCCCRDTAPSCGDCSVCVRQGAAGAVLRAGPMPGRGGLEAAGLALDPSVAGRASFLWSALRPWMDAQCDARQNAHTCWPSELSCPCSGCDAC